MNKLISSISVVGLFLTFNAFADTGSAARAFKNDKAVESSIQETIKDLKRVYGAQAKINVAEPSAVLLHASSGVVGVSSVYLVTSGITPQVVNGQTTVIAVRVNQVGTPNNNVVSLLSQGQLSDIVQATKRP